MGKKKLLLAMLSLVLLISLGSANRLNVNTDGNPNEGYELEKFNVVENDKDPGVVVDDADNRMMKNGTNLRSVDELNDALSNPYAESPGDVCSDAPIGAVCFPSNSDQIHTANAYFTVSKAFSNCETTCSLGFQSDMDPSYRYFPYKDVIKGMKYYDEGKGLVLEDRYNWYTYSDNPRKGVQDLKENWQPDIEVCNSSFTGDMVYSPDPDSEKFNWKCKDVSTGYKWKAVAPCNDGVDNDGDGGVDHTNSEGEADSTCGSPSDTEAVTNPNVCPAPVVGSTEDFSGSSYNVEDGEKAVFHGRSSRDPDNFKLDDGRYAAYYNDNNDCYYEKADLSAEGQETDLNGNLEKSYEQSKMFSCVEEKQVEEYSTEERGLFCTGKLENAEDVNYSDEEGKSIFTEVEGEAVMPALEYYVRKENIPPGQNQYADYEGFDNRRFMTLHQAEKIYFGEGSPHDPNITDRNMLFPSGEYGDDFYNYSYSYLPEDSITIHSDESRDDNIIQLHSWVVKNSGIVDENISSKQSTLDAQSPGSNGVFPGGFAGRCKSIYRWKKKGDEWGCHLGGPTQEIGVEFFRPTMRGDGFGDDYVGFRIPDSEMEKWETARGLPADGSDLDGDDHKEIQPVTVEAQCFVGTESSIPDDDSSGSYSNVTAVVENVSDGVPTRVVTQVPERPGVDKSDEFSCVFGFTQTVKLGGEEHSLQAVDYRQGLPPAQYSVVTDTTGTQAGVYRETMPPQGTIIEGIPADRTTDYSGNVIIESGGSVSVSRSQLKQYTERLDYLKQSPGPLWTQYPYPKLEGSDIPNRHPKEYARASE